MKKYFLTEKQYDCLWSKYDVDYDNMYHDSYNREKYWKNNLQDSYKLEYIESRHMEDSDYYGSVIGDEKYITMFLLTYPQL